jgi:trans-aconitate methyltransferase
MAQRRQQFELEQRAAREILASSRAERGEVTRIAYDRLYREAPWHPALQLSAASRQARAHRHASLLARHVARARMVLEVGCGSGHLLTYLAQRYPAVSFVGLDISVEKLNNGERAALANLRFQAGDCVEPAVAPGSFDLVISSQVLEHFHPDDVATHLCAVRQVLAPGGTLELDTPNRWTGPHDVSAYFAPVACGTHLKEWTFAELHDALRSAGFARVWTDVPVVAQLQKVLPLPIPGDALLMPARAKVALESGLRLLPGRPVRRGVFRLARMTNNMLYAETAR